jgi:6-phosphofructokinase 1
MKKLLITTGGGDCPGLNAVIRAIVKSSSADENWEVYGSMDAFEGVLSDSPNLIELSLEKVAGIHVKGGTILHTTTTKKILNHTVSQVNGE